MLAQEIGLLNEIPKIDCHCHVIDPNRFAYEPDARYRPTGHEIAPLDHLMRMMDLNSVHYALVVGTNSFYGENLRPVLDVIERGEGRFKGIGVVANDIAERELARLKTAGIVGVVLNSSFHGTQHYAKADDLVRKLADLDMILQLQVKEDQLLDFLSLIEASRVRLVIDHCGKPVPQRGLDQPGFKALLGLGRSGRAIVKLSGFSQFSGERYPYRDVHPFFEAVLAAFTPDACMWGSDWPFLRARERTDYGPLLQLVEAMVPSNADRTKIFWETPRRLYGL